MQEDPGQQRKSVYSLANLDDIQQVGAKLGKGSRASVKLVKHKSNDQTLALKVIDLSDSKNYQSELQTILTECNVHQSLHHPNLIT